MTRVLLVVPDRERGWRDGEIRPLLDPDEATAYAAFTSAGLKAEVVSAGALPGRATAPGDVTVLVRPEGDFLEQIERGAAAGRGPLVVVHREEGEETLRRVRDTAFTLAGSSRPLMPLSRRPRHGRALGWRGRLLSPSFLAVSGSTRGTVKATWKASGLPAMRLRERGGLRIWSLGFHPDHLSPEALLEVLETVRGQSMDRALLRPPLPERASAVVLLLHDVEEPLPGDPNGIASVRAGLEAGLDAEARYGFHATYNAVGAFAETIPDLIQRIVAEGHELASHGATHRVVADLPPEALHQELADGEDRLLRIAGVRIRGFRSPRSRWSDTLLGLLVERDYRWNAEVDGSPFPYRVPAGRAAPLVRIPVAVDDWNFVKHRASPRSVRRSWEREVRWAMERGSWVAIGSHPSVLGVDPGRLAMYRDFLEWLSTEKVRVLTHDEGVRWWLQRAGAMSPEAPGAPRTMTGGPA